LLKQADAVVELGVVVLGEQADGLPVERAAPAVPAGLAQGVGRHGRVIELQPVGGDLPGGDFQRVLVAAFLEGGAQLLLDERTVIGPDPQGLFHVVTGHVHVFGLQRQPEIDRLVVQPRQSRVHLHGWLDGDRPLQKRPTLGERGVAPLFHLDDLGHAAQVEFVRLRIHGVDPGWRLQIQPGADLPLDLVEGALQIATSQRQCVLPSAVAAQILQTVLDGQLLAAGAQRAGDEKAGSGLSGGVFDPAAPALLGGDVVERHQGHRDLLGEPPTQLRGQPLGDERILLAVGPVVERADRDKGPDAHPARQQEEGRSGQNRHQRRSRSKPKPAARPAHRRREACRHGSGHTAQLGSQGGGVRVALPAILGQAPGDDGVDRRRDLRHQPARGRGLLVQDLEQHGAGRRVVERADAGEHLVQSAAQREDVRAAVHFMPLNLLRGHVGRRAHQPLGQGDRRLALQTGSAEVAQLDRAVAGPEDVGGFDVAVDDPVGVGISQRLGDLAGDAGGFVERQGTPAEEHVPQVLALHVFHDDRGQPAVGDNVVDRDDVRVLEPGGRPGFPKHPFP